MKIRRSTVLALGRAVTAVLAGAILVPTVMAPPAHAASQIFADHTMAGCTGTATLVDQNIHVHLPMSREDAEGYIYNGARIEITVHGDDPYFDDTRWSYTYSGRYELRATSDGLRLDQRLVQDCSLGRLTGRYVYNEDAAWEWDRDEIYFKARWVDGDGASLSATSNVVFGYW